MLASTTRPLAEGKLKYCESIVEGINNAPKGLIALLKGENLGKQLVKLGLGSSVLTRCDLTASVR